MALENILSIQEWVSEVHSREVCIHNPSAHIITWQTSTIPLQIRNAHSFHCVWLTIEIRALFHTVALAICPRYVASENPDEDPTYAGSPPRLRNPTISAMLLVRCDPSELGGDSSGSFSNTL